MIESRDAKEAGMDPSFTPKIEKSIDDLQLLDPGLKGKLAAGLAAAREGDLIDGEAFFDELDAEEEDR